MFSRFAISEITNIVFYSRYITCLQEHFDIEFCSGVDAFSFDYFADIFDVGTTNGEANISKVSVKDEEEFFGYIPGLRDPFSPYNKRSEPRMMATSVDGYSVYKGFIGGVKITNPKKTARIIPSILRR